MSDKTTDNSESSVLESTPAEAAASTESVETPQPKTAPKKSGGGLGGKVLAELQEIAGDLKIEGASSMRKGELIDAIKAARGDAKPTKAPPQAESAPTEQPAQADRAGAGEPGNDEKPARNRAGK